MWNHAQYLFWALMAVLKHLITNKCTLAGQWSVVTLEFSTVSVSVIQKFDSVGQASLTPRPGSSMPRNNLAHTRYKIQDTRPLFASTSSRCCWSTRQNCQNWEQRRHSWAHSDNWGQLGVASILFLLLFGGGSNLIQEWIPVGSSCKVYGWAHVWSWSTMSQPWHDQFDQQHTSRCRKQHLWERWAAEMFQQKSLMCDLSGWV